MKQLFHHTSQVTREHLDNSNINKESLYFYSGILYEYWAQFKSILSHNNAESMTQEISQGLLKKKGRFEMLIMRILTWNKYTVITFVIKKSEVWKGSWLLHHSHTLSGNS